MPVSASKHFPVTDRAIRHDAHGKKHLDAFPLLAGARIRDLSFYPVAVYAVGREDQQEFFVHADSLVDLLV